jgi:hypothetical protein
MGGGVGEAMLIGAAMGGGSAAMTGGDPLKGALLGAAGGGFGAGIAGAQAGGAAGASGGASGGAAGGASGAAGCNCVPSAFDKHHTGRSLAHQQSRVHSNRLLIQRLPLEQPRPATPCFPRLLSLQPRIPWPIVLEWVHLEQP